jgi:MSHA biogenesis protein MshP
MKPRHLSALGRQIPRPERSRREGFALVTAIFLLVVLAALGAFIANISATSSITTAQDLRGSRAYHAAQAGMEWGLFQVLDPNNATVVAPGAANWPNMPDCPVNTTLTIEAYTVLVTCARSPAGAAVGGSPPVYTESGVVRSVIMYELVSTASAGGVAGGLDFVERQVQVTVSKCRALDGVAPGYACP